MIGAQKIFTFTDPVDYLQFRLTDRRRRDPRYSVAEWARELGYENSSYLSQVLKRERKLKAQLVARMARDLKLRGRALKYFECLAYKQNARSESERAMYANLVRQLRPRKFRNVEKLPLDIFNLVADWQHTALLEMIHLEDFREDAAYLRGRLTGNLSAKAISKAVALLLEVGLLSRDSSGRLQRGSGNAEDSRYLGSKKPSEAIRTFHRQTLELARAAIQEQPMDERYLRGTTLPLKREHYDRATEIIQKAHRQLLELAAPNGADEVYQFSSQLFRLTKNRPPRQGLRLH